MAEAAGVELVVETTRSLAAPRRSERPRKVTNAFSVAQERLPELKRARMVLSERGMEKFVWPPEIRRGMDWPRVTFVNDEPDRVTVEQPVALAEVQVEPVKPFVHIQAHEPLSTNAVPPFWQAVAVVA